MTKTKEKNSFQLINHVIFHFCRVSKYCKVFLNAYTMFYYGRWHIFYAVDEHETIYNENTNIIVSQWMSDALRAIWSYHFEKKKIIILSMNTLKLNLPKKNILFVVIFLSLSFCITF